MNEPARKCPVCGETDPYPAWFCLLRAAGEARIGEPCTYSREGHDRMTASLAAGGDTITATRRNPDPRP